MKPKFRTAKEYGAFLVGSLGVIGLIILVLHFATGCATTPNSSFESCSEFCKSQGKLAAFVTVENGQPCQKCRCADSMDELIFGHKLMRMATPREHLDFLVEMWNIQTDPKVKKYFLDEIKLTHKEVFGEGY